MSSAPSPAPPPFTAAWILEFVLRQPIPDHLVHAILLALPLPSPRLPARLSKLILLRHLSTDLSRRSLSPRTLHSLELIHHLSHPLPASAPMRRAYCAVAVHCTLRTNFPAALDTIWNRRMGDLQRSDTTGLAGEDVRCWRAVLEEAVENEELRRMLAEGMTEEAALEAVRAYLKHEMDAMGPPFLQLAAERFPSPAGRGEEPVGVAMNIDGPLINHHNRYKKVTPLEMAVDVGAGFACRKSCGRDILHTKHSVELEGIRAGMAANDAQKSMAQDRLRVHGAANGKTTHNQDRSSLSKLDSLPAHEVRKVSEALKSICSSLALAEEALKLSCANLATAVEDPLPGVLTTASIVIGSIENRSGEARNINEPQESPDQLDEKGPLGLANNIKESQVNHRRIEEGLEKNKDREAAACKQSVGEDTPRKGTGTILRGNKYCLLPRPSIMERNHTAHTFEWVEDSIDSPSESSPSPPKKRVLPSFQSRGVSPLMFPEIKVPNKHRKKKKWSLLEEDTLRQAVEKYGVGNWKYILSSYSEIFEDRTPGDLKDKWRNMTKH